jgi:glutamyl-tRNA reductase
VAQQELARTLAKLASVTDGDRQQLEELTRRIVNKLLHDPIQVLRETDSVHSPMAPYLHAVEKLFKLEESSGPAVESPKEERQPEGEA